MIPGHNGCQLALLAVVCVLTIFLFPAMQGPYSVVHGPATALLALRSATRLRLSIRQAAHRLLSRCRNSPAVFFARISDAAASFRPLPFPEFERILRC